MSGSVNNQRGFIITLLLLAVLMSLPIIAWGGLSATADTTGDASIIVAMENEEGEAVEDVEPVYEEEEVIEESEPVYEEEAVEGSEEAGGKMEPEAEGTEE